MVTGTPAYLAPEVARGDPSDFASDVFSLGATLFAALEGTPPFGGGDNPMAVLHRVASGQMQAPRQSGVLTPVLTAMLQPDPTQRPGMPRVAADLAAAARAADDPAAGATTQRFDSTMPLGVPPSTTVSLPPAVPTRASAPMPGREPARRPVAASAAAPPSGRPPAGPPPANRPAAGRPPARRSSGSLRWAIVGVAALLVIGIAVIVLSQLNGSHPSAGGTGASSTAARSSLHSSSRAASKASSSAAAKSSPRATSTAPSRTSSAASTSPSSSPSLSSSSTGNAGGGTKSARLVRAIEDYYALLPGDTASAWNLLTPSYQQNPGGGRGNYDSYWNSMQSVTATGVSATGSSTVVATITYVYKSGKRYVERTSFGLVEDGDTYKIDRSSVLGGG